MKKEKIKINISKERAIKIIEDSPKEIKKIHCFMSFIGCDWDRKSVINEIKKCENIAWIKNVFNHNLAIIDEEGRQYNFDIQHKAFKK